ncbi:MAG: hypothetical protein M1833_002544 [Piccolia ochrophora]|nr:MAG: hypothetical protein M1833_002544 [Piccolia ochrophora]
MSQFGGPPKSPTAMTPPQAPNTPVAPAELQNPSTPDHVVKSPRDSPTPPRSRAGRPSSRPVSMVQTYHPPLMEVAQDTLPELQPIFTFLNSHSNKLYQEGYFLKLNDLDTHGRPNADRVWTECFAQLVGTVLSLWDASALDAAGQDGEVLPNFINLTDASIKMIETLPTRAQDVQPLQNVLSISTAGKNRYLLHFNSLHSLTQWTAGIRLAMFEHATLQELYTGSLIAGKGKGLNNISVILDRTRLRTEDWVRVRFGAGTPWRRCWCVIAPPDEKEYQKHNKQTKKKSAYDRAPPPLKGDMKFYDTKKTKKMQPIATITDAYSAYAIYPQSKPLIDQSTLVKVEGTITIHSKPPSTTEGFVFVMPEVHPAVTGFEMMLRWLFPVFDTFGLYGRPTKLIADTLDVRGLMFAMPKDRRYGYLEILDVAGLIHTEGSNKWREADWRKKMKELTSNRISALSADGSRQGSRHGNRRGTRSSLHLPSRPSNLQFDDTESTRSGNFARPRHPGVLHELPAFAAPQKADSAPPSANPFAPPGHKRSISEARGLENFQNHPYGTPGSPPPPPSHAVGLVPQDNDRLHHSSHSNGASNRRSSSESDSRVPGIAHELPLSTPPEPVATPPAFAHPSGAKPPSQPFQSPELRRANSRMSTDTLSNLAAAGASAAWTTQQGDPRGNPQQETITSRRSEDNGWRRGAAEMGYGQQAPEGYRRSVDGGHRGVITDVSENETHADYGRDDQGLVMSKTRKTPTERQLPSSTSENSYTLDSTATTQQSSTQFDSPLPITYPQAGDDQTLQQSTVPVEEGATDRGIQSPSDSTKAMGPVVAATSESSPAARDLQRPSQPPRLRTSQSIARKPVPGRTMSTQSIPADTPRTTSSLGSLQNHMVDQGALDRVFAQASQPSSDRDEPPLDRQVSHVSSIYDAASVDSPDYASTRKSTDTKRSAASIERPRTGVLRTVGTVEPMPKEVVVGDTRYQSDSKPQPSSSDIPSIDFGPTMNYAHSRPGTSQTQRQSTHERTRTPDSKDLRFSGSASPSPYNSSPITDGSKRDSHGYSGRDSPGQGYGSRTHSRSPSRNLVTPEPGAGHGRTPSGDSGNDVRRSIAWQPGMAVAPGSPNSPGRQTLTAEQFVQQRAQQSRTVPVYAHQRKASRDALRSATPPSGSGEHSLPQSRNSSGEHLPRPASRGASSQFHSTSQPHASGDISSYLSAREQEHVARVTGSTLINLPGAGQAKTRQQAPSGGLVGAIEAREREKRGIKEGVSGQMVQHAINQRRQQEAQFQAQQAQAQSQAQAQYHHQAQAQAHAQYGHYYNHNQPGHNYSRMPSTYGTAPQYPQQQPQAWTPPTPHMPGAWVTPGGEPPNSQRQSSSGPYFGYGQGHGQSN